jgi:hypothetical protein
LLHEVEKKESSDDAEHNAQHPVVHVHGDRALGFLVDTWYDPVIG